MTSPHIYEGLNDEQRRAVELPSGPVLILAGAGSGKTTTVVRKIAHMIHALHIPPDHIIAVTFTNKAARELVDRVHRMLGFTHTRPLVGTFHSLCARMLRDEIPVLGYTRSFNIYDEGDSIRAVRIAQAHVQVATDLIHPEKVRHIISTFKNELKSPDDVLKNTENFLEEQIVKIYTEYQNVLKQNNALDFDDLIMKTVEIWKKHPDILEKYQDHFPYVFIDEYQDTNHAQYEWARLLAKKYRNICVVGDDAQAIYSFRGANYKNILNFKHDYPDAEIITLDRNYRSTQEILDIGNDVISHNVMQSKKSLWTDRQGGKKPRTYEVNDEVEEAELIIGLVSEKGRKLHESVVLYRTNAQSRALEERLLKRGIPYRLIGGVRFYERKEIKDILAYLRWILNAHDSVNVYRILNEPPRGLGDKTWSLILAKARELQDLSRAMSEMSSSGTTIRHKKLKEFVALGDRLRSISESHTPDLLIDDILSFTGYEAYLKQAYSEDHESRIENVKELKTVAQKYSELPPRHALEAFVSEVALVQDVDNWNPDEDALTLMTIHAAKGLEFKKVFLVGLEEGLLPHMNSMNDPSQLEEERRLCYVAVTRAREELTMTFTRQRKIFGSLRGSVPSRFLLEVGQDKYDFHSTSAYNDSW